MEPAITLGAVIRAERDRRGLSLQALAEMVGVNRTSIMRFERDERRPKAETLQRIAVALSVPATDLFALSGYGVPTELPTLRPYLRTKYGLDEQSIGEIADYIARQARGYGDVGPGPADGEDERDE